MSGTGKLPFMAIITQSLIVVFTIIGFISKCLKKVDFIDLFVVIYLFGLFIYPDMNSGMRFLFPIIPFLLYYVVVGLMTIKLDRYINKTILIFSLGLFVLIPYCFSIRNIIVHQNETLIGPQEKESVEAWDYVKNNTPKDAIIAFEKPRALALYSDRKTIGPINEKPEEIQSKLKDVGVNYILTNIDLPNKFTDKFIDKYDKELEFIWINSKFHLYRLKSI